MYTDRIAHIPSLPFTLTQLDYLLICDKDHCAAKILRLFEAWSKDKAYDETCWMCTSIPSIQRALLFEYGEKSVAKALKLLKDKEFVLIRQNPSYKWDKTNQYQFQHELVQSAIDRITSEDIAQFFNDEVQSSVNHLTDFVEVIADQDTNAETAKQQPKIKSTWVYLIQALETNYYKIGISINPQARLKGLQCQSPHKLVLIDCQIHPNAWRFEQSLHSKFSSARTQGEWFCLSVAEAKAITEILSSEIIIDVEE